jgi:hypothetical protein
MTWVTRLIGDHNREEFIRTLDSLVGIVLQVITLGVQVFGLYYIMHHPR